MKKIYGFLVIVVLLMFLLPINSAVTATDKEITDKNTNDIEWKYRGLFFGIVKDRQPGDNLFSITYEVYNGVWFGWVVHEMRGFYYIDFTGWDADDHMRITTKRPFMGIITKNAVYPDHYNLLGFAWIG